MKEFEGNFLKNNKRRAMLLASSLLFAATQSLLVACDTQKTPSIPPEQIPSVLSPEIAESLKARPLVWRKDQLAISQADEETLVSKYHITVYQKPPYYQGPEPLEYTSYKVVNPIGVGLDTILLDDYGPFKNFYVYEPRFTLKGAQTLDEDGKVLAEAILDYPSRDTINTKDARWYLREIHYNRDGLIQFVARSELDSIGHKTKELASVGVKRGEFYSTFPLFP